MTGDWRTLRADFVYDHGKETGHPLAGAHAGAQCLRCHNDRGPVSLFAVKGCAGCDSALRLNVHLHVLVSMACTCATRTEDSAFAEIDPPTHDELHAIVQRLSRRGGGLRS